MRSVPVLAVLCVTVLTAVSVVLPTGPGPAAPGRFAAALPAAPSPPAPPSASRVAIAPAFSAPAGVEAMGPAPSNAPMGLVVGLPSKDPDGLAGLVAAESVPGSPVYRTHLTGAEAASRFGATSSDVRVATAYFEGYGLNVSHSPDGLLLYLDGPTAAVARAFDTTFEEYRTAAGRVFVSHPTPADLPSIVPWSGAFGLGNETEFAPAVTASTPGVVPSAACSATGDLVPCQVQTAYSVTPLLTNGSNGTGIRLAVVDAYSGEETQDELEGDIESFTAAEGVPLGNVSYFYPVPTSIDLNASTTNSGWWLEDALDLEWTRALSPGASIEMTFSPNAGAGLYAAIDALVGQDRANVISLSWGEPDVGVFDPYNGSCPSECNASTDGSYAVLGPVLELAAVEGITVFAASGDCGASGGTAHDSTFFPASDPYVTGVGGTELDIDPNGTWEEETGWDGNASGSKAPGCSMNPGGSGGGYSPFPTPWWQVGPGFSGKSRGVPDVSADAQTPVLVYTALGEYGAAGTSVATPIWAGITADMDSYAGSDLGFLNPSLYRVLNSSNYSADFHDIVTGNNGYPAGPGWDPVTGIGTPIVSKLVANLARPSNVTETNLSTDLSATPTAGRAPLTTTFTLSASGGSGQYPLEGVYFGDGNASLVTSGTVQHTYPTAGVYAAQSFVYDSRGYGAISSPVPVVVGGGSALSVQLWVSPSTPSVGAGTEFTALVNGGTAPYTYSFFFGDGASDANESAASVAHTYRTAGLYCAEVIVSDSSVPVDGGASGPTLVAVGGATAPGCAGGSPPHAITANGSEGVRDAPADFPALFATTGGPPGKTSPPTTTVLASNDPYTKACACTIFRQEGTYQVGEWINDSAVALANASVNVTVAPPLLAVFTASVESGRAPLEVEFSTASVTGGDGASAAATRWSFGNGVNATGATANATYDVPGEYLAVGSLSDRGYGNASEAFLIDVEPSTGAPPLGATGTIAPASRIESGQTVTFSTQPVGPSSVIDNATVLWNLTEGHSAYGLAVDETYFAPLPASASNTLTPTLVLRNAYLTTLLTVPLSLPGFFAIEAGGFVPAADALVLNASAVPASGPTPLAVEATANAEGPGGATVEWSWGGGLPVAGSNASYTYDAPGGYTAEASARDPFGDVAIAGTAITADLALDVTGGPTTTRGSPPLTVNFSVSAYGGKGPPYSYSWTLPNGTHATGPDLNLTLARAGSYTVTLLVTDANGTEFVRSWTISVTSAPTVSVAEILSIGAAVGVVAAVVGVGVRRRRPPPTP